MKIKLHFITIMLIFSGLTMLTASSGATAEEIWNSKNLSGVYASASPAINGMILVWEARGGLEGTQSGTGDLEIFACDLAIQEIRQITDDDSDDIHPQTDGNFIVWQKFKKGSGNRIFLFDIQNGSSEMISPPDLDGYAPLIADGKVVWTAQKTTAAYEAGEIMLYDAAEGSAPEVISATDDDCSDPHISPNFVVWLQQTADGVLTQWAYGLNAYSPSPEPADNRLISDMSASSDRNYSVIARRGGGDSEIFLLDGTGGQFRITDNDTDDKYPVMSRNHAAWITNGAVSVADLAGFMKVTGIHPCRIYAGSFVACWKPVFLQGVDEYRIDISEQADFSMFVPGYQDKNIGVRNSYLVRGLRPDTTYYFRLRAVINGSVTADSCTATVKTRLKRAAFSIFQEQPHP